MSSSTASVIPETPTVSIEDLVFFDEQDWEEVTSEFDNDGTTRPAIGELYDRTPGECNLVIDIPVSFPDYLLLIISILHS